jgi:hypothetical protein
MLSTFLTQKKVLIGSKMLKRDRSFFGRIPPFLRRCQKGPLPQLLSTLVPSEEEKALRVVGITRARDTERTGTSHAISATSMLDALRRDEHLATTACDRFRAIALAGRRSRRQTGG